jgi:hypothetical protein
LFFFKDYSAADAAEIKRYNEFSATVTIVTGSPQVPGNTSAFSPYVHIPFPPFDWDNDGKTDIGVYRPNPVIGQNSFFYLQNSSNNLFSSFQFGSGGDLTVTEDYNGDHIPDLGVWRRSNGFWYIADPVGEPATHFTGFPFGIFSDIPVTGDFDGDRRKDFGVFRQSEGIWYIRSSLGGNLFARQFGLGTDKPVPEDYNGDGRTDLGVYRDGIWYVSFCPGCPTIAIPFGLPGDIPTPADYDGDGIGDVAVFRPSSGIWYVEGSAVGFFAWQFGQKGDDPLDGDFDGTGNMTSGYGARRTATSTYSSPARATRFGIHFGQMGDVPIPSFRARNHY